MKWLTKLLLNGILFIIFFNGKGWTGETKIVSVDQNKIPIKSQISISTYSHHRLYSEKLAVELSLFL